MPYIPKKLTTKLRWLNACERAMEWAPLYDRYPQLAWEVCNKPNWLLWIVVKLGLKREFRKCLAAILEKQVLPFEFESLIKIQDIIALLRRDMPDIKALHEAAVVAYESSVKLGE